MILDRAASGSFVDECPVADVGTRGAYLLEESDAYLNTGTLSNSAIGGSSEFAFNGQRFAAGHSREDTFEEIVAPVSGGSAITDTQRHCCLDLIRMI